MQPLSFSQFVRSRVRKLIEKYGDDYQVAFMLSLKLVSVFAISYFLVFIADENTRCRAMFMDTTFKFHAAFYCGAEELFVTTGKATVNFES